jgi:hypothetical protein
MSELEAGRDRSIGRDRAGTRKLKTRTFSIGAPGWIGFAVLRPAPYHSTEVVVSVPTRQERALCDRMVSTLSRSPGRDSSFDDSAAASRGAKTVSARGGPARVTASGRWLKFESRGPERDSGPTEPV